MGERGGKGGRDCILSLLLPLEIQLRQLALAPEALRPASEPDERERKQERREGETGERGEREVRER
eukprot:3676596-Rhodomonas_salina.1